MNGASAVRKRVAGDRVAGDRPRLDQRRPLPVLAVALVVELGVLAGQRQRMARQMRPQAQVGAEDVAVLGPGLEQVDEAARQPDAERHRALAAAVAQPVVVEEDDQVDVAGEVQLAGAELAHAEHEHAAASAGSPASTSPRRAASPSRWLERQLDGAVGQRR